MDSGMTGFPLWPQICFSFMVDMVSAIKITVWF